MPRLGRAKPHPPIFGRRQIAPVSPPPPPTGGVATFTNATTTQVNATATDASGGTAPYTYQWQFCATATGVFVDVTGKTSLTLDDTVNNLGFRWVKYTDSAAQTAFSNLIYGGRWSAPIILGGVGDSLMIGYPDFAPNDPLTATLLLVKLTAERQVTIGSSCNRGTSGSTTATWLPADASGILLTAETAFNSASVTDVVLMLGTNDARASISAATYGANLGTITTHLLANVASLLRIWLCYPPWSTDTGTLTAARYQLLIDYGAQINSLVNGTTIRQGDILATQYFAAHTTELVDTIHLTHAGYASLGDLWANAMDNQLNVSPPSPPGPGSGYSRSQVVNAGGN